MYQLRYLVCMWLVVQGQHLLAQEHVGTDNSTNSFVSAASQAPGNSSEVRPLVDPLVNASQEGSHAPMSQPEGSTESAALPRTPTFDAQPVGVTPSEPVAPSVVSEPVIAQTTAAVSDVPTAPTPVLPEDLPEKIVEPTGIDTVDVKDPQGNWLFKRLWWEKSKELYGKIRERVDKIVESRMHFFKERVKLAQDVIDPFYVEIGLDEGSLQSSVAYLFDLLKKDQDKDGALSAAGKEKLVALQEEKAAITQLSESVTGIQEMSNNLDDALERLMEQINLARSYESEAWQRLDQIAEELSDKKAREHYYAIAALWRNVKDIGNYIQGPFAQHFIKLAQASVRNVQNVRSIANLLQQKGFKLQERLELTLLEEEKTEEDDDEDIWPKKELGWGAWFWKKITDWFSW